MPPKLPLRIATTWLIAIFSLSIFCSAADTSAAETNSARHTPIVRAVQRAQPAVVNISSEKTVAGRTSWDTVGEGQRVNGMGSGVVIHERGYIITNAHVVDRVTTLRVKLADGTNYDATTIAIDRATDLALIRIDAGKPLPTIPMGTSSDLMIGETVIAVGNAYGYENTVTRGIISALGRTVRLNDEMTYYDLIQTDSSINPGNSGGALLNIDGELVGVNVAIRAGAQGISFAIPVNTVKRVAADMLNIRKLNQIWHGLGYQDAPAADGVQTELLVQKVEGPAQKCGIHVGDRIVRVGSAHVRSGLDLERTLLGMRAGEQATLVVRRGTAEETVQLVLEPAAESPSDLVWRRIGLRLSVADPYQVQRYQPQLSGGLYVAQVQAGSPAAAAGVRSGDFLLGLHKWSTLNYDNVLYVLEQHDLSTNSALAAHILRNGESQEFQIRVGREAKLKDARTESADSRAKK